MRATVPLTPPSTPEPRATGSELKRIQVTRGVESLKTSQEVHVEFPGPILDADRCSRSWKLICVPADQIESNNFWLNSEPEINIVRKTADGESYEIVLHTSYLQWLTFLTLEINLDYDPTAPTGEDISAYGTWEATERAHIRFLRNAVHEIRSEYRRGYEECCRDLARAHGLAMPLERAILIHDILESDPPFHKYFSQCLVFIGLNLLGKYDSHDARELLAKDQADFVQVFQKCRTDPLKALSAPKASIKTLPGAELQTISLVRSLFELCNGMVDCRKHALNQKYRISDNLSLYGALVGVAGENRFGNFDPKQMHDALLQSKVFEERTDIRTLNTVEWSMQMMEYLPIGFPEGYLDLPSHVLSGLGSGEVDLVRIYLEQIYHRCPSLHKPENNILLLLTWSSIVHGRPLQVLSEWASAGDASELRQRLIGDLQNPQEPEQLTLILAALLCQERLLPYTSNDTIQPINGCYLADLDVLLNGVSLSNQRTVFERLGFSFLRVFATLENDYEDVARVLAVALDKDVPLLDKYDGFTDQYVAGRIKSRLSHVSASKDVGFNGVRELNTDDCSSSGRMDGILEDYYRRVARKGCEDYFRGLECQGTCKMRCCL